MSLSIDTKSASAVAKATCDAFARAFAKPDFDFVHRIFSDVESMFEGRYLDYRPIDTPYHDFEHTLQVTLCFSEMMAGRQEAGIEPRMSERQFVMGLAPRCFTTPVI